MKNQYTIEAFTKTEVLDDVIEAETAQEALAARFGGNAEDYYPCINIMGNEALYCVESNGSHETFAKTVR